MISILKTSPMERKWRGSVCWIFKIKMLFKIKIKLSLRKKIKILEKHWKTQQMRKMG
jgi:hypothetical protein